MKSRRLALIFVFLGLTLSLATVFAQEGVQPPAQQPTEGIQARMISPTFAGPPAGTPALPTDLFSSENFYQDSHLWLDQRYFRCNTPRQLTDLWTSRRVGENPPTSVAWGDCTIDFPREQIVSPYSFATAEQHYAALLTAARTLGGPTVYTRATTPDWDGYWVPDDETNDPGHWIGGRLNQTPTILSLLTAEYQERMVQMNYHEAVNNSPQWNASFCYPEGFMRWWTQSSATGFALTMNAWHVQFLAGTADNFLRQVLIGKEHVQKVPQWYGETVGFWDGTTLVAWTANVQGWTLSHSMFEFSNSMETLETWTPSTDETGRLVLDYEVVFYDPEAFVQPLHATYRYIREETPDDPDRRYTFIQCLSNLRNTEGRPTQLTPSDSRFVDYYGRPWAQNWEQYFEVGWEKPEPNDLPNDVLDLLDRR